MPARCARASGRPGSHQDEGEPRSHQDEGRARTEMKASRARAEMKQARDAFLRGKPRSRVPHEFVLDALEPIGPVTKPMFGCLAVYVKRRSC